MVDTVNQIAHAVGIKTTAEYVEDLSIIEILQEISVDYALAYPSSVDDLTEQT